MFNTFGGSYLTSNLSKGNNSKDDPICVSITNAHDETTWGEEKKIYASFYSGTLRGCAASASSYRCRRQARIEQVIFT